MALTLAQGDNLTGRISDRASTHTQHHIARLRQINHDMREIANLIDKDWLYATRNTQSACEASAICCDDRGFSCTVNLRQQNQVGGSKNPHEILKTISGAGITMRLEGQDETSVWEGASGSRQRCSHFGRMVPVI
ncbi:MAG: hypothetical protein RLZZ612_2211, partial [Pseudomonadota bacterium]